ncbi:MAG: hypothetical protein HY912_16545 [Desulfomonile tiedjei]|uniref:PilZ domain-containing protein n=1 Tax=Desulfomonile tiedjei TaxID=2358 RepID=A0A9D6Z4K7_9BACT|nr:hypothetical protein [Desulfomonile tiedjei]
MSEVRKIKAGKIVADIRARLTDFELMAKYDLSWKDLQDILRKLVQANAMRPAELEERSAYFDDPINRKLTRATYRAYLRTPIPIQDLDDIANQGFITDLSETGFRTMGIVVKEDDDMNFLVRAGEVSEVKNLQLRAICKWANKDNRNGVGAEAGFRITGASSNDISSVRRLMETLSLGDRNLMRTKSSR